jgi:hypothetical protein
MEVVPYGLIHNKKQNIEKNSDRRGGTKMNEWERLRRQAQRYKENYPPGTRVMLLSMEDPWAPVPSGTRGTVEVVDDIGQLHMKWDNSRTLALVPREDSFRKLTVAELREEQSESIAEAEDGPTMEM